LAGHFHSSLLSAVTRTLNERQQAVADGRRDLQGRIADQVSLLEDLRVHLQNVSLSEITGQTLAERQPLDPSVPRILKDKDGHLYVGDASGKPLLKEKVESRKREAEEHVRQLMRERQAASTDTEEPTS
jgi:hypothetical protein